MPTSHSQPSPSSYHTRQTSRADVDPINNRFVPDEYHSERRKLFELLRKVDRLKNQADVAREHKDTQNAFMWYAQARNIIKNQVLGHPLFGKELSREDREGINDNDAQMESWLTATQPELTERFQVWRAENPGVPALRPTIDELEEPPAQYHEEVAMRRTARSGNARARVDRLRETGKEREISHMSSREMERQSAKDARKERKEAERSEWAESSRKRDKERERDRRSKMGQRRDYMGDHDLNYEEPPQSGEARRGGHSSSSSTVRRSESPDGYESLSILHPSSDLLPLRPPHSHAHPVDPPSSLLTPALTPVPLDSTISKDQDQDHSSNPSPERTLPAEPCMRLVPLIPTYTYPYAPDDAPPVDPVYIVAGWGSGTRPRTSPPWSPPNEAQDVYVQREPTRSAPSTGGPASTFHTSSSPFSSTGTKTTYPAVLKPRASGDLAGHPGYGRAYRRSPSPPPARRGSLDRDDPFLADHKGKGHSTAPAPTTTKDTPWNYPHEDDEPAVPLPRTDGHFAAVPLHERRRRYDLDEDSPSPSPLRPSGRSSGVVVDSPIQTSRRFSTDEDPYVPRVSRSSTLNPSRHSSTSQSQYTSSLLRSSTSGTSTTRNTTPASTTSPGWPDERPSSSGSGSSSARQQQRAYSVPVPGSTPSPISSESEATTPRANSPRRGQSVPVPARRGSEGLTPVRAVWDSVPSVRSPPVRRESASSSVSKDKPDLRRSVFPSNRNSPTNRDFPPPRESSSYSDLDPVPDTRTPEQKARDALIKERFPELGQRGKEKRKSAFPHEDSPYNPAEPTPLENSSLDRSIQKPPASSVLFAPGLGDPRAAQRSAAPPPQQDPRTGRPVPTNPPRPKPPTPPGQRPFRMTPESMRPRSSNPPPPGLSSVGRESRVHDPSPTAPAHSSSRSATEPHPYVYPHPAPVKPSRSFTSPDPPGYGDAAYTSHSTSSSSRPRLRPIRLPRSTVPEFLNATQTAMSEGVETCALLLGTKDNDGYKIATMFIPRQISTNDSCTIVHEDLVRKYQKDRSLHVLGWIHSHRADYDPFSSADLHLQCRYQSIIPEVFAIAISWKGNQPKHVMRRFSQSGLRTIQTCEDTRLYHDHGPSDDLFEAPIDRPLLDHVQHMDFPLNVVDIRIP